MLLNFGDALVGTGSVPAKREEGLAGTAAHHKLLKSQPFVTWPLKSLPHCLYLGNVLKEGARERRCEQRLSRAGVLIHQGRG